MIRKRNYTVVVEWDDGGCREKGTSVDEVLYDFTPQLKYRGGGQKKNSNNTTEHLIKKKKKTLRIIRKQTDIDRSVRGTR